MTKTPRFDYDAYFAAGSPPLTLEQLTQLRKGYTEIRQDFETKLASYDQHSDKTE